VSNRFSNELEQAYLLETSFEKRKKFAQFFTPYLIARFMAQWVLGGNRPVTKLLDPAIGLGVFIRALAEENISADLTITGYDVDPQILRQCAAALTNVAGNESINLSCRDYLFTDWHEGYDAIIGNPPYFKFQDYATRDAALREFQQRVGVNLSGFTNIYALFLLKSLSQLNRDGRCAYIIPSEFLNADYGRRVKEHLIQLKSLRYILIFDFDKKLFDEALTTSSILLFANDEQKQGVEFINVSSVSELEQLAEQLALYPRIPSLGNAVEFTSLNPSIKWRTYYQKNHTEKYSDLAPFSTYAKVSRGIATGANDFFLFTEEKAKDWHIPSNYLLPVVSKAAQVPGHFFTQADFTKLRENNKPVYLLNAKDTHSPAVNDYLFSGEHQGVHHRHLTSHRKPWYAIEKRQPSPLWVSVFSRGNWRFIKNEAGVRNLTTFHCVYLNPLAMQNLDLFFSYLLTDISREIFSDHRREYGDGLEKFEPNDLNRAKMLNLEAIPQSAQASILKIYKKYRASCLAGTPDLSLLEQLNKIYSKIVD
jgi:adenine-specific DNA-methyltransferase